MTWYSLDSANHSFFSKGYFQLFSTSARSKAVHNLHCRVAYGRLLRTGLLTFAILFKWGYTMSFTLPEWCNRKAFALSSEIKKPQNKSNKNRLGNVIKIILILSYIKFQYILKKKITGVIIHYNICNINDKLSFTI